VFEVAWRCGARVAGTRGASGYSFLVVIQAARFEFFFRDKGTSRAGNQESIHRDSPIEKCITPAFDAQLASASVSVTPAFDAQLAPASTRHEAANAPGDCVFATPRTPCHSRHSRKRASNRRTIIRGERIDTRLSSFPETYPAPAAATLSRHTPSGASRP